MQSSVLPPIFSILALIPRRWMSTLEQGAAKSRGRKVQSSAHPPIFSILAPVPRRRSTSLLCAERTLYDECLLSWTSQS